MSPLLYFLAVVFLLSCVGALIKGILWFISPVLIAKKHMKEPVPRSFYDPKRDELISFGDLVDKPSLFLSVIIPAYNEQERLPAMLNECLAFLDERFARDKKFTFEIIIVDDCSRDKTVDVAMKYVAGKSTDLIRVLCLEKNRGKGGAIREGVLSSRGRYILMADADGATTFADLAKLEAVLDDDSPALIAGSRAHLEEKAIVQRHLLRNILMHGFHFIVSTLCVRNIRDTQCGFKLFNRSAAQLLFPPLHIERWAFDVELFYLANMLSIQVVEIPVRWQEIPGSKLDVFSATVTMLRELLLIRFCYTFGIWKSNDGGFRLRSNEI